MKTPSKDAFEGGVVAESLVTGADSRHRHLAVKRASDAAIDG